MPKKKRGVDAESVWVVLRVACCETAELRAAMQETNDARQGEGTVRQVPDAKIVPKTPWRMRGPSQAVLGEAKTRTLWGSRSTKVRLIYQAERTQSGTINRDESAEAMKFQHISCAWRLNDD